MATDNFKEAYYTPSHEWLLCIDGGVRLGITEYAQQQLGEIVFIELPTINRSYKASEKICVIESIKTASEIDAPFSCTILEINHGLSQSPSALNTSPLSDGWICIVQPTEDNWQSSLMNESQYINLLSNHNNH